MGGASSGERWAGAAGPAPGRGRRGAAVRRTCASLAAGGENLSLWVSAPCSLCGSALLAAASESPPPPSRVPNRAPSSPLGPRPQASGKCAALRRGPRPPERRVAGEGGRPWTQRAPLPVSPPQAPPSPLSQLCSTLADPGSLPLSPPVVRRRRVPILSVAGPLWARTFFSLFFLALRCLRRSPN